LKMLVQHAMVPVGQSGARPRPLAELLDSSSKKFSKPWNFVYPEHQIGESEHGLTSTDALKPFIGESGRQRALLTKLLEVAVRIEQVLPNVVRQRVLELGRDVLRGFDGAFGQIGRGSAELVICRRERSGHEHSAAGLRWSWHDAIVTKIHHQTGVITSWMKNNLLEQIMHRKLRCVKNTRVRGGRIEPTWIQPQPIPKHRQPCLPHQLSAKHVRASLPRPTHLSFDVTELMRDCSSLIPTTTTLAWRWPE
jgi:hypothetical protein